MHLHHLLELLREWRLALALQLVLLHRSDHVRSLLSTCHRSRWRSCVSCACRVLHGVCVVRAAVQVCIARRICHDGIHVPGCNRTWHYSSVCGSVGWSLRQVTRRVRTHYRDLGVRPEECEAWVEGWAAHCVVACPCTPREQVHAPTGLLIAHVQRARFCVGSYVPRACTCSRARRCASVH
jgi:hypothetical protein